MNRKSVEKRFIPLLRGGDLRLLSTSLLIHSQTLTVRKPHALRGVTVISRSVAAGTLRAILYMVCPALLRAQAPTITCSSKEGERNSCPADTSAGVALQRSTGTAK